MASLSKLAQTYANASAPSGGRRNALVVLEKIPSRTRQVRESDGLFLSATTGLSPHLKFGTISVREAYHAIAKKLGTTGALSRNLYWRDFFTHIGYHFPRVFSGAFQTRLDFIAWENDPEKFAAWCEGRTGFPLVDAGMRELNATGYLPHRLRMVVASFLNHDLHIDWRWGEKFFATRLVDYDPCANNGNWQWVASSGCDGPFCFRFFNPWLQQEKWDPACAYIHKWIRELGGLEPSEIHRMKEVRPMHLVGYPVPIVDHGERSKQTRRLFAKARAGA